ncbi:Box C/D snoRNA accumulation [Pseudogymnoascus australis]
MLGPLSKILATTPLSEAYTAFLEESRRATLTPEEKAGEKRRRAVEVAEKGGEGGGKRVKTSPGAGGEEAAATEEELRDQAATGSGEVVAKEGEEVVEVVPRQNLSAYKFYLHRPLTRSSGPTVLIPLRADEGLERQLAGKVVLEFPRVYVFPVGAAVPGNFEIEGEGDTSSSGSSSEEESEDEEDSGDEDEVTPSAEADVEGEEGGEGGEGDGSAGAGAELSIPDRTDMNPQTSAAVPI